MRASIVYKAAAVLLVLFAIGHTLGFSQADPTWKADALVAAMRSTHFNADGFQRSFWDLYLALGYVVGLLYLFAAVLAWQLSGLPAPALSRMRATAWAFALAFAGISVLSWRYLFLLPLGFSLAVTLCLTLAAWLASRPPAQPAS